MIKKLPKLLKTSRLVIDNDDGKIIVYMNTDDKMKKELPFQLIDPVSWGYIYEKYVGQYFESIGYNVNYWGLEKVLLITNVVPLLLGTFAETCSLNLPQKGRKAGHDCLWAVA